MKSISAIIVQGHRVASGLNGNPKFPGGTLAMQAPFFRELGLDLSPFHPGTLNVSIAPRRFQVIQPKLTFRNVRWHPVDPPEDFSFFDVTVNFHNHSAQGLIYYPHPDTKPTHFQAPEILELLLPPIPGIHYGAAIDLSVPGNQAQVA